MNKLISLITSAVMSLCCINILPVSAVHAEESSTALIAGKMIEKSFDGITVELDGDAIRFNTDYTEVLLGTETEISLSRTDNGYLFRPKGDGNYVVSILYYPPSDVPEYETFWFPPIESFTYEISINDSIVNINAIHRAYEENDIAYIESFLSDGTVLTNNSELSSIFAVYYLVVCLAYKMDPLFIYYLEDGIQTACVVQESLIMSNDENAEMVFIQNDKLFISKGGKMYYDFPAIGEAALAKKTFEFSYDSFYPSPDDEESEPNGSIRFWLNESRKTKMYEIDYVDYELVPSTLKITVCPENDINGDGSFNVADVVLLQSFLLGKEDALIINWRAADLCGDGVLDIFDLVCMRRALISSAG